MADISVIQNCGIAAGIMELSASPGRENEAEKLRRSAAERPIALPPDLNGPIRAAGDQCAGPKERGFVQSRKGLRGDTPLLWLHSSLAFPFEACSITGLLGFPTAA